MEQEAYSVAILPDERTNVSQSESPPSFVSLFKVTKPLQYSLSLDAILNSQNKVHEEMEKADLYTPRVVPITQDEAVGNLKVEDSLTRTVQRQISIQMGGNFMQLLMDNSVALPKFNFRDKSATERVHHTPNNRARKYKRSAPFNSRKVVLLFSVLKSVSFLGTGDRSSMGTLILIYLTLRVRQMADGSLYG